MARRTGTEPTQVPSTSKAERRISVFVFDFREMNDFSLGPLKRIFYTVFRTKNHNQHSFRPRNLAPARHGFPLQGTEPTGARTTSDTEGRGWGGRGSREG